jgi:hypothetical protein
MTSDQPTPPSPGDAPQPPRHMSARVPERVGPGVFSTGVILMTGRHEFIFDFVQNMSRPHRVAARVVIPHAVMPQFIEALKTNLALYTKHFGPPPSLPKPASKQPPPSPQQIYDDLKLPDDMLPGAYANGVMIGHNASEFGFDFLTNFLPHSAVSCRVFLSAPQVPRLLHSMTGTFHQFEKRMRQQGEQGENPEQLPPPSPDEPPQDDDDA